MINASILQGVRPIEVPSQFEGYKNALAIEGGLNQNAMAQYSLAKARREDARTQASENALRGADFSSPEGRTRALNSLSTVDPRLALEYRGKFQDQDIRDANLTKSKLESAKILIDQATRAFGSARDDQTAQQAFAFWKKGSPEQAAIAEAQYVQARQAGVPVAEIAPKIAAAFNNDMLKYLEAMAPKTSFEDIGGSKVAVNTNSLAGPVGPMAGVNALTKTLSPEGQETVRHNQVAEGISRGNLGVAQSNLGLSRERLAFEKGQSKAPAGYRYKADGVTLEAIPGGPAEKDKALTEVQGKATGFAIRAKEAEKILSELEGRGVRDTGIIKSVVSGTLGALPLVGDKLGAGASAGMNTLHPVLGGPNTGQQKTEQARRDFVNAVLRMESGAVISPSEFENASKQYFPQPGDTKEVIDQKRRNRQAAVKALEIQAGPGMKSASGGSSGEWSVREIK